MLSLIIKTTQFLVYHLLIVVVVYFGAAGTNVVGLITGTDRGDRGPIGGDMHQRHASITGFLGATPKPARARTRPRPRCGHLWLST